jgi:hypothetical protein
VGARGCTRAQREGCAGLWSAIRRFGPWEVDRGRRGVAVPWWGGEMRGDEIRKGTE